MNERTHLRAEALLHFLDILDDLNPEAHAALERIRWYVAEITREQPTFRQIEEASV